MSKSPSTTASDAAIKVHASRVTRMSGEKQFSKFDELANTGERLDQQFQDHIRAFVHDPVSCGQAAADFVRRNRRMPLSRASSLICMNTGERAGSAIAAFAIHLSPRMRSAVFRAALKAQPIENLDRFARELLKTVPEGLRQDLRDDLVVSASEVLDPKGLQKLSFELNLSIPNEMALTNELIEEAAADNRSSVVSTQVHEGGPNWAMLLTVFGSAAFFLVAFVLVVVWLISLL